MEVVERAALIKVVDDFLRPFIEKEPPAPNATEDRIPDAASEYIARRTGKTTDMVARALYRIKKESTSRFVDFAVADWIVAVGMGRADLFHTELEVITQGNSKRADAQMPKRKKRPPVPPGVPVQKCPGPFCQGQERPRTTEVWYFYKGGRDAGEPLSYCKKCSNFTARKRRREWNKRNPDYYRQYHRERRILKLAHQDWRYYGYVPYSKVEFAVEELCRILGPTKTAQRIGIHRSSLLMWRRHDVKNIYKERAARVLQALLEVRQENSNFHKT